MTHLHGYSRRIFWHLIKDYCFFLRTVINNALCCRLPQLHRRNSALGARPFLECTHRGHAQHGASFEPARGARVALFDPSSARPRRHEASNKTESCLCSWKTDRQPHVISTNRFSVYNPLLTFHFAFEAVEICFSAFFRVNTIQSKNTCRELLK